MDGWIVAAVEIELCCVRRGVESGCLRCEPVVEPDRRGHGVGVDPAGASRQRNRRAGCVDTDHRSRRGIKPAADNGESGLQPGACVVGERNGPRPTRADGRQRGDIEHGRLTRHGLLDVGLARTSRQLVEEQGFIDALCEALKLFGVAGAMPHPGAIRQVDVQLDGRIVTDCGPHRLEIEGRPQRREVGVQLSSLGLWEPEVCDQSLGSGVEDGLERGVARGRAEDHGDGVDEAIDVVGEDSAAAARGLGDHFAQWRAGLDHQRVGAREGCDGLEYRWL